MRKAAWILLVLLWCGCALAAERKPNFLIIMADQQSPHVLGCAGDRVVRTPNLDQLAASGVRFTATYCGSPLCVPSRMTFLTARHCSDIEVWTNACVLDSETPTFPGALAAAGYETVLAGRMHFAGPDQRHGFTRRTIGDVSQPRSAGERETLAAGFDFAADDRPDQGRRRDGGAGPHVLHGLRRGGDRVGLQVSGGVGPAIRRQAARARGGLRAAALPVHLPAGAVPLLLPARERAAVAGGLSRQAAPGRPRGPAAARLRRTERRASAHRPRGLLRAGRVPRPALRPRAWMRCGGRDSPTTRWWSTRATTATWPGSTVSGRRACSTKRPSACR